jgi:hypothetical protein
MAQETLERTKTAAKETARKVEEEVSASADRLRELSLNLINMSHDNIEFAFEFARDATAIRTSADMVNLWTTYTHKQLELFSAQSKQLTKLGQKFVTKSAPSITPEG